MVQLGATQPEAYGPDISEHLMGQAIKFVACHEVGHSLGLRHNMIASNAFSVDSLRSRQLLTECKRQRLLLWIMLVSIISHSQQTMSVG